jgi:hypothetical protein
MPDRATARSDQQASADAHSCGPALASAPRRSAMFTHVAVKNFRCFRELRLGSPEEPLARINLIGGKNNSGKTALLEALFLHMGPNNPGLALVVNAFRGIDRLAPDADQMWGWLFFGKNLDDTIELASMDDRGERRVLRLRLMAPEGAPFPQGVDGLKSLPTLLGSLSTATVLRDLVMEYEDSTGQRGTSRASILAPGLPSGVTRLTPVPPAIFLSSHACFAKEDAERYSRLEEIGRERDLLQPLRLLEPRLRRLAVLTANETSMLHGDIGIGRLVPVPFMGEGMGRLLSIVLAITSAPGGLVLIDEVENGLHYSVMADVWKAIAHAARQNDVQVFATTHSYECIQAAHRAQEENPPYEFRYYRLDRRGDQIVPRGFDREMLDTVQTSDLEIR